MQDDIVTRLRMIASEFPRLNEIMDGEWSRAADEIERLRTALREIAANGNSEPYSAEYAADALNGKA